MGGVTAFATVNATEWQKGWDAVVAKLQAVSKDIGAQLDKITVNIDAATSGWVGSFGALDTAIDKSMAKLVEFEALTKTVAANAKTGVKRAVGQDVLSTLGVPSISRDPVKTQLVDTKGKPIEFFAPPPAPVNDLTPAQDQRKLNQAERQLKAQEKIARLAEVDAQARAGTLESKVVSRGLGQSILQDLPFLTGSMVKGTPLESLVHQYSQNKFMNLAGTGVLSQANFGRLRKEWLGAATANSRIMMADKLGVDTSQLDKTLNSMSGSMGAARTDEMNQYRDNLFNDYQRAYYQGPGFTNSDYRKQVDALDKRLLSAKSEAQISRMTEGPARSRAVADRILLNEALSGKPGLSRGVSGLTQMIDSSLPQATLMAGLNNWGQTSQLGIGSESPISIGDRLSQLQSNIDAVNSAGEEKLSNVLNPGNPEYQKTIRAANSMWDSFAAQDAGTYKTVVERRSSFLSQINQHVITAKALGHPVTAQAWADAGRYFSGQIMGITGRNIQESMAAGQKQFRDAENLVNQVYSQAGMGSSTPKEHRAAFRQEISNLTQSIKTGRPYRDSGILPASMLSGISAAERNILAQTPGSPLYTIANPGAWPGAMIRGLSRATGFVHKAGERVISYGRNAMQLGGRGMFMGTMPIVGGLLASMLVGANIDQLVAWLRTQTYSGKGISNLSQSEALNLIKQGTSEIPISPAEAAQAGYYLASAGLRSTSGKYSNYQQLFGGKNSPFVDILKFAYGQNMPAAEALPTIIKVLNAYRINPTGKNVRGILNQLALATKVSPLTASDLTTNLGRVVAIGRNRGMSLPDILSSMAYLSGILPARQAATGLETMLMNITQHPDRWTTLAGKAQGLGFNDWQSLLPYNTQTGKSQNPMVMFGALQKFFHSIALTEPQKAPAVVDYLMHQLVPSIRGTQAFSYILKNIQGTGSIPDISNQLTMAGEGKGKDANLWLGQSAIMLNTPLSKIKLVGNAFQNFAAKVTSLKPVGAIFEGLAGGLSKLFDAFSKMPPRDQIQSILTLLGVAAAPVAVFAVGTLIESTGVVLTALAALASPIGIALLSLFGGPIIKTAQALQSMSQEGGGGMMGLVKGLTLLGIQMGWMTKGQGVSFLEKIGFKKQEATDINATHGKLANTVKTLTKSLREEFNTMGNIFGAIKSFMEWFIGNLPWLDKIGEVVTGMFLANKIHEYASALSKIAGDWGLLKEGKAGGLFSLFKGKNVATTTAIESGSTAGAKLFNTAIVDASTIGAGKYAAALDSSVVGRERGGSVIIPGKNKPSQGSDSVIPITTEEKTAAEFGLGGFLAKYKLGRLGGKFIGGGVKLAGMLAGISLLMDAFGPITTDAFDLANAKTRANIPNKALKQLKDFMGSGIHRIELGTYLGAKFGPRLGSYFGRRLDTYLGERFGAFESLRPRLDEYLLSHYYRPASFLGDKLDTKLAGRFGIKLAARPGAYLGSALDDILYKNFGARILEKGALKGTALGLGEKLSGLPGLALTGLGVLHYLGIIKGKTPFIGGLAQSSDMSGPINTLLFGKGGNDPGVSWGLGRDSLGFDLRKLFIAKLRKDKASENKAIVALRSQWIDMNKESNARINPKLFTHLMSSEISNINAVVGLARGHGYNSKQIMELLKGRAGWSNQEFAHFLNIHNSKSLDEMSRNASLANKKQVTSDHRAMLESDRQALAAARYALKEYSNAYDKAKRDHIKIFNETPEQLKRAMEYQKRQIGDLEVKLGISPKVSDTAKTVIKAMLGDVQSSFGATLDTVNTTTDNALKVNKGLWEWLSRELIGNTVILDMNNAINQNFSNTYMKIGKLTTGFVTYLRDRYAQGYHNQESDQLAHLSKAENNEINFISKIQKTTEAAIKWAKKHPIVESMQNSGSLNSNNFNGWGGGGGVNWGKVPGSVGRFKSQIMAAAKKTGVPAWLLASDIMQESSGNPKSKSWNSLEKVWDIGLMQGGPSEFGKNYSYNPAKNIMGGAMALMSLYNGPAKHNWNTALAMYNAGAGNPGAGMGYASQVMQRGQGYAGNSWGVSKGGPNWWNTGISSNMLRSWGHDTDFPMKYNTPVKLPFPCIYWVAGIEPGVGADAAGGSAKLSGIGHQSWWTIPGGGTIKFLHLHKVIKYSKGQKYPKGTTVGWSGHPLNSAFGQGNHLCVVTDAQGYTKLMSLRDLGTSMGGPLSTPFGGGGGSWMNEPPPSTSGQNLGTSNQQSGQQGQSAPQGSGGGNKLHISGNQNPYSSGNIWSLTAKKPGSATGFTQADWDWVRKPIIHACETIYKHNGSKLTYAAAGIANLRLQVAHGMYGFKSWTVHERRAGTVMITMWENWRREQERKNMPAKFRAAYDWFQGQVNKILGKNESPAQKIKDIQNLAYEMELYKEEGLVMPGLGHVPTSVDVKAAQEAAKVDSQQLRSPDNTREYKRRMVRLADKSHRKWLQRVEKVEHNNVTRMITAIYNKQQWVKKMREQNMFDTTYLSEWSRLLSVDMHNWKLKKSKKAATLGGWVKEAPGIYVWNPSDDIAYIDPTGGAAITPSGGGGHGPHENPVSSPPPKYKQHPKKSAIDHGFQNTLNNLHMEMGRTNSEVMRMILADRRHQMKREEHLKGNQEIVIHQNINLDGKKIHSNIERRLLKDLSLSLMEAG